MNDFNFENYTNIYTHCRRILGKEAWGRVLAALDNNEKPDTFADSLYSLKNTITLPDFIFDLARIEWIRFYTREQQNIHHQSSQNICVNPSLNLVPVSWKNIPRLIEDNLTESDGILEASDAYIMVWKDPESNILHTREAADIDLLALKIITEQIDPHEAAHLGNIHVRDIQTALNVAIKNGILLAPESKIKREHTPKQKLPETMLPFLSADIFTLQWHITQRCDLHCKHCYDRSDRASMSYDEAIKILNDFYEFCTELHVRGQISFTGGNPLLYPRFNDLYQTAYNLGFEVAILGNPTPIKKIKDLLDIAKPAYFQISLEGLEEYNDQIRGQGHFERSMVFLKQLRQLDIFTMVMLTLTNDNIHQVLPLADILKNLTNAFNFNRLSTVGEGAQLLLPEKSMFESFLREYEDIAQTHPILGLKDNLINIIRQEKGFKPFGGCTGFGCGAAFNFVALLPDGEVHACRKFPSLMGNIFKHRLIDIYNSELARKYRKGSNGCRQCELNIVCRGCMASTYSRGLNIFEEKDPYCFISDSS